MLQGLGLRLWDWVWDLRLRFRGMTCPKGRAVPQTSEQGGIMQIDRESNPSELRD